jgi:hypothetical protein
VTTTTFSDRRSGAYLEFHATHNKLARGIAPSGQSRLLPQTQSYFREFNRRGGLEAGRCLEALAVS